MYPEEEARYALENGPQVTGVSTVAGFVKAERPDRDPSDFSRWHPPPVPRQYKGVHLIDVSPLQEAQEGSLIDTSRGFSSNYLALGPGQIQPL